MLVQVGYGLNKKNKLTKFIEIEKNDVKRHEDYNSYTDDYDIAVINLKKSIESTTPKVKSVLLNKKNDDLKGTKINYIKNNIKILLSQFIKSQSINILLMIKCYKYILNGVEIN